ncbi:MAG: inovirus-type Gp2 protein [Pseudomonadota bacterium]
MSKFNPLQRTSEAHAYIEIEKFVRLVIETSAMPFETKVDANGQQTIIPRLLANDFHKLTRYWNHYHPEYDYEVQTQAFWDSCIATGFIGEHGPTDMAWDYSLSIHAHAYATNDLVRFIRTRADTKDYKRRAYDKKYQASEKCASIESFIDEALARYAKSLVVRVDMGYQKSSSHQITIADVYDHVDGLCMAKQSADAFRGLVGYALAIEQGVTRGYHIHFVAIIDGNQFQSGRHRGAQFASLWQRIVGNDSAAHICDYDPVQHAVRGVGQFRRNEPDTHKGVVQTMQYLTEYKEDQYLRARPSGRRALRTFLKCS